LTKSHPLGYELESHDYNVHFHTGARYVATITEVVYSLLLRQTSTKKKSTTYDPAARMKKVCKRFCERR
jgi:hypothetical protein